MYTILVKIEGIEKRKRSAALLHVVAGLFLIAKAADLYRLTNYQNFVSLLPVYIIAIASLVYGFFRKRFDPAGKYNPLVRLLQLTLFVFLGISLIYQGRPVDYIGCFVYAGLCLLLFFSERKIYNDTNLIIDKNGLTIPGYYTNHHIDWNKLSEIVVRQDYVTIFHKNNKYLQYQVIQSLSTLEIAQINGFCKDQIAVTHTNDVNMNANL